MVLGRPFRSFGPSDHGTFYNSPVFRRAWRRLRATPLFTTFAVVSLALGVGVTTAIYSVIVSLTDFGLRAPHPDRIGVIVGSDPLDGRRQTWRSVVSRADLVDLSAAGDRWRNAAVSARFSQSLVTPAVSELVTGEAVSGNYFSTLSLAPAAGRLIQPSDDAAPSRVAVLGHQFWRTRLGGDTGVVGSVIRIGGEPFEVVGIGPPEFGGLSDRIQSFTAVWVPLSATTMFPSSAAPPEDALDRRRRQLSVMVPIANPSELSSLSQQVRAIGERLDVAYPIDMRPATDVAPQRIARAWSLRSLNDANRDADRTMVRAEAAIMAIVGLVLVVACTNLANLVLARASTRQHELAVRSALGASRTRLMLDELAETGVLAVLGAVTAFVVARVLMLWFTSTSLPISEGLVVQLEPKLNMVTIAVAAGSVLLSLAVFGLAPALQITRGALRSRLATDGGAEGHFRWRARRRLIGLQVAISLSFFLIAAFAVRIAVGERARSSGIDVDRLAIGQLNFRLPPWTETRGLEAVDRLMSLARSQPGLDAVAVSSGLPFGLNYTPHAELAQPGRSLSDNTEDHISAPLLAATPSIFETLGVPIVRGRAFDDRDGKSAPPVAVLSEQAARQMFRSSDAVGRRVVLRPGLRMSDDGATRVVTVIGIAGDTDTQRRFSREAGSVYVPLAQHYEPTLAVIGRTAGDPAQIIGALKTLGRRADPDLVVDRPATGAMILTGAYVFVGVVSRAAGGLALLALILAMAGLFGVLSHLVARRTREMGLRMALGAEPRAIRRLIIADGLRPVLAGIVVGLGLGVLVRLLIRSAYHSPVSAADVLVFALAPVPIVLSALLACYWPARRASKVDPNVALREL